MPTAEELANKPAGTPDGSEKPAQPVSGEIDYSKIDYTKIDWSKVPVDALPEDVIKETPVAKKLLNETIERRKTIKQMKEALEDKPAEDATKPTAKTDDAVPEWARQLMTKVESIETTTKQKDADKTVDEQMAIHKLPADVREFLTGTPDEIKSKAAKLAKTYTQHDGTSPGAGGTDGKDSSDIVNRARAIIQAKLDGSVPVTESGKSIFGSRIQSIK